MMVDVQDKISIVDKVKKAVIQNQLVGNTVFNPTEYKELLERTREISKDLLEKSVRGNFYFEDRYYGLIFVTLVEITKRWEKIDDDENDDRGFWDYVIKTILGLERGSTNYNKLYSKYTDVIDKIGLFIAKKGKKYYTTLMMHAFAPIKSIYAFLDLSYNIFKNDLNFNYTYNDKDICERATSRFCEILKKSVGDDKSISIGTNSYNVKIGLRTLALENASREYFIDLLDKALSSINLLFYGQSINLQSYFEQLVNSWWQDKQSLYRIDKKNNDRFTPTVSKAKINVKFIRIDNTAYLVIPPIQLDNGLDNTYHLLVYAGGSNKNRISEELFTKRGEFFYATKQKNIDLNDLLQDDDKIKIQVEIKENEKTIFNSKLIDKEFILFDNENEVSSDSLPTSNYFLYSRDISLLRMPENISTYAANLYNIYPNAGETLSGSARHIYFRDDKSITVNKNTINLIGCLSSCIWVHENKEYNVYNNRVELLIPGDNKLDGIELNINDKKILLSKLPYHIEESYCLFDISKYLPENEPMDILLYSHLKDKILLKMPIIVFHGFSLAFTKTAFYGDDKKKLTIMYNNISEELHWINKQNELIHPSQNGNLIIKLPYIKWRIDNKEWHNEPLRKKLWHKNEFHNGSVLEISSDIEIDSIYAVNSSGKNELKKTGQNFEIGRYIYSNEDKEDISFDFIISNESKNLFTVTKEEHFYNDPLVYSEGKLYWCASSSFVGDEARQFKLEIFRNKNKHVYFYELYINDDETIEIDDGLYQIKISSKENKIFESDDKIFYKKEIFIGQNKCIKLLSASEKLDKEQNTTSDWKQFFPEYYIEYRNMNNHIYYIGDLFTFRKDGSKKYLDKMENAEDEWEQINPVRIDFLSDSECEIGAGYDTSEDEVLVGALVYDKVRKSICNKNTSNEKSRYCCLNRYKFKEVKNV